jgi:uncharacterized protein YndB with AHSA1/START domain
VNRCRPRPPEVALTVLQFEFQIGGTNALRIAFRAGTMFVNGVYRVIEPPSTIVFSWNIEPPDENAGFYPR